MKLSQRMLPIALFVSICASAQAPKSSYDPTPGHSKGQPKSFTEFVFSRINPRDIDYGVRIEEYRQSALGATVQDAGFWADAFAVAMLGMAFIMIYWQHRKNQNVRFHTARLLIVYRSELAQARAHGEQLQSQYERLKRTLEERSQDVLDAKPVTAKRDIAAAGTANSGAQTLQNSSGQRPTEQQLREENERLKRQLGQDSDTSASLRRQVTTLTKRLEEEQQKIRRLRGE